LVCVLEQSSPAELELRSALASLAALGLEGTHLSRLVARCGGVRALLALCIDASATSVRIAALRALAIVCCDVEGVRQLDQVCN
jgi:precorrin isomerase